MLERELKLFIPRSALTGLKEKMAGLHPQTVNLHASYYDTPERTLAHKKAALRIRLEGDKWVQTLKMAGPDELSTIEINHRLPHPVLDLSHYQDGPAQSLFNDLTHPLTPRYETRVQRQTALVDVGTSQVELALDEGVIKAEGAELPISEIEFELISGDVEALFEIGETWLRQFNLLIELRSKSERGDSLAKKSLSGALGQHATPALALAHKPYQIKKRPFSPVTTMQACYADCSGTYLNQIIRNAAFLGGVDNIQPTVEQQAEYLSAMRVGMRRLRSCHRLFRPWMTRSEKKLSKTLRFYFSQLGEARDHDLLRLETLPKLIDASVISTEKLLLLPPVGTDNAGHIAASVEFQLCLLHSLKQLISQQSIVSHAPKGPELYPALHELLHQQLLNIQAASKNFKHLSPRRQHRLRNWIKGLRYCLEFLGTAEHKELYECLRTAQHTLGQLTDTDVTLSWSQTALKDTKRGKQAESWLKTKRERYEKQSALALKPIIKATYPSYMINANTPSSKN